MGGPAAAGRGEDPARRARGLARAGGRRGRPRAPAGGGATSTCACGSRPTRPSSARATTSQTTVRVPLTAAVLGGEAQVPTLDGPVGIKIPPGTPAGQVFRLRGHGLPKLGAQGRARRPPGHAGGRAAADAHRPAEGAVRGAAAVRDVTRDHAARGAPLPVRRARRLHSRRRQRRGNES